MSGWGNVGHTGGAVLLSGALAFLVCPAAADPLANTAQVRISLTIPARATSPTALRIAGTASQSFDLCLGTPSGFRI